MIFIALIAVTTVQIMKFNHFKQDKERELDVITDLETGQRSVSINKSKENK